MKYIVKPRGGGKTTELARRALNAHLDGGDILVFAPSYVQLKILEGLLRPWGVPASSFSSARSAPFYAKRNCKVFIDNYDLVDNEFSNFVYGYLSNVHETVVTVTGEAL